MLRRTKIVATLGPATDRPGVLEGVIKAGVNIVRLNFSHGAHEEHIKRAEVARSIADKLGVQIGVLSDLQGPKIRIDKFKEGSVFLEKDDSFILDSQLDESAGTKERVGIAYKELIHDVKEGDILLLDDGRIILKVTRVTETEIYTVVGVGGELSDRKGINLKGGGLSAPALTDKDRKDLICAASFRTDFLAISFPKTGDDIREARALLTEAGSDASVVAKIERLEALDNIDDIILASDAIMIARGDLAVEIGDAKLVGVQKRFIMRARQLNRAVITATQMMESMIHSPSPTRAEVMDVANAVLDGTDAVMLSAESAVGRYPIETVRAMAEICVGAESEIIPNYSNFEFIIQGQDYRFKRTDEAIALSAIFLANHYDIEAVVCLTETGTTAMIMSRMSSELQIYGLTRNDATCGKLTICRGVKSISFPFEEKSESLIVERIIETLKGINAVKIGDKVLITFGTNYKRGGTNHLRIVEIE